MVTKVEIDNVCFEVFDGVFCRVILTADDEETLRRAAFDSTAMPSIVIGRSEGGIEKWLTEQETPDNRKGALLQFWGGIDRRKEPFGASLERFEIELSYRIRQGILVKPFTTVFNALDGAEGKLNIVDWVGHCGDAYEWFEKRYNRDVIVVPTMVPDFIIERYLGYAVGVMGANFWIMCKTKEAMKEAGAKALKAIHRVPGVITPFDICSAGSKPETKFPWIGPTTNHIYCPSLREKLGEVSLVPENVHYIPEIVINGVTMDAVKEAVKAGIEAVLNVDGVVRVSAGAFGGLK